MMSAKKVTPEDLGLYSDLYKDVYGFRPRGITFASYKEYQAKMKRLQSELVENIFSETRVQARNADDLEQMIEALQTDHTIDRAQAIRWLIEAERLDPDSKQDREHYYWLMGLSWVEINKRMCDD